MAAGFDRDGTLCAKQSCLKKKLEKRLRATGSYSSDALCSEP